MPTTSTIESSTALDYRALFELGLEHVERLSRRIWNDYNVHDPGITTLELLCYALTDLSYRASFPVADLLAIGGTTEENVASMNAQFFSARTILPNRALTANDYRKLLIDLPGVKNAWVVPTTTTYWADTREGVLMAADSGEPGVVAVNLQGLYDVLIEYMENIDTIAEREATVDRVRARLHANRNLCEDFVDIREVASERFILCGELELEPDADVSTVKAEILFRVGEYLSPPVVPHSLAEMLERLGPDGLPLTADQIFDGPALDNGFIDDAELALAELPTELRLSDIISVIMDVPGVRSVREAIVAPSGGDAVENRWVIPVTSGRKALLDRAASRLVFYKRNVPVVANEAAVAAALAELDEAARAITETPVLYDFEIPVGTFRDPSRYYSFQNHFPAVYGIGPIGLGAAGADRLPLAFQLKAYLLFFDQVMANYFAQLAHVRELFSTDPDVERTYYYQVVDSFMEYDRIYRSADVVATIESSVEDPSVLVARRNRFLDHLISRFAERFHELVSIMGSAFGASASTMIGYKCAFLRDYPAISSDRSLAYNYSLDGEADLWNSANISGLERRLARLLGLTNHTRRNLGDVAYDLYAEVDATPDDEYRFRVRRKDNGRILLSSSTRYATMEAAREEMRRAIGFASTTDGYDRRISSNGKHYFNIVDETKEVLARRIEYFDTVEEMESEILATIEYLRETYSEEGIYLIENILLRREEETDPFLPICPDPNCVDCSEADPYSYRIHVILPAFGGRFDRMEFREWAETTIREETPAHILPKVCWISREDMAVLEKVYRDWIYLKAGVESADRTKKLRDFIQSLFSVKNVYPPQKLADCSSPEEEGKFILGRTAL